MGLTKDRMVCTCKAVLFGALALSVGSQQADAWDADVHYGLTKWLAVNAGFTDKEADEVAWGNWDVDLDKNKAAINLMVSQVMLGTKAEAASASERILEHHFPAVGKVGTEPPKRPVSPANSFAVKRIELARKSGDLSRFGQALHALQDSWSHQGEPDVPIRPVFEIRRPYAWSHPRSRGGWYRHRADITFMNDGDAMEMAERTHTELRRLCQDADSCRSRSYADWSEISQAVNGFVTAKTIKEKKKWFQNTKPFGKVDVSYRGKNGRFNSELRFVDDTSIPYDDIRLNKPPPYARQDGMTATSMELSAERPGVLIHRASTEGSRPDTWWQSSNKGCDRSFEQFVARFLGIWLRREPLNLDNVFEYIDQEGISEQINAWARDEAERLGLEPEKPRVENWIRVFLRMWLVRDHGAVEVFAHGFPFGRGYASLEDQLVTRTEPQPPLALLPEVTPDATIGIRSPNRRFDVFQLAEAAPVTLNGACGAVFRFSERLDEDAVILVAHRRGSSWRFVRLAWLAL